MLPFLLSFLLLLTPVAHAATPAPDPVQAQIDQSNAQIAQLKAEIVELQKQLNATSAQKQTLQNAINGLNLNIKKITTSITLTSAQIAQKDEQIRQLTGSISTTTSEIGEVTMEVGNSLSELQQLDNEPVGLLMLTNGTLSSFFDAATNLASLRNGLQQKITQLSQLKGRLVTNKTSAQQQRAELATLQKNLAQQKTSLNIAKDAQSQLLAQTKSKESSYQALIAQKQAEEKSFEATLVQLAKGLGSANTSSAPSPNKGILAWPLDSISVTQYFGNTSFALSGAYNGSGHNGVDFRASIGTPVHAALSGTVQEINQGSVRYCQYGKWVLVRHANGLSTLYAHLSSIAVSDGQAVSTGDIVGYSGDTGYATGPHLHLTVYVASAVSFKQYTCNSGQSAFIPIAPLNAYLNPLSYLPSL